MAALMKWLVNFAGDEGAVGILVFGIPMVLLLLSCAYFGIAVIWCSRRGHAWGKKGRCRLCGELAASEAAPSVQYGNRAVGHWGVGSLPDWPPNE